MASITPVDISVDVEEIIVGKSGGRVFCTLANSKFRCSDIVANIGALLFNGSEETCNLCGKNCLSKIGSYIHLQETHFKEMIDEIRQGKIFLEMEGMKSIYPTFDEETLKQWIS